MEPSLSEPFLKIAPCVPYRDRWDVLERSWASDGRNIRFEEVPWLDRLMDAERKGETSPGDDDIATRSVGKP